MTSNRNQKQTAGELKSLYRNEQTDSEARLVGYQDESGAARAVPGDDETAFLKTPPFTTPPAPWLRDLLLDPAGYLPTEILEVSQRRLLQVYIEYTIAPAGDAGPPNGLGMLSLIPEARIDSRFFVIGVVNLTVATVDPPGAVFGSGFGSRNFQQSELRTVELGPVVFGSPARVWRTTLTFDVAPYEAFRLNASELTGTGPNLLSLDYTFSE